MRRNMYPSPRGDHQPAQQEEGSKKGTPPPGLYDRRRARARTGPPLRLSSPNVSASSSVSGTTQRNNSTTIISSPSERAARNQWILALKEMFQELAPLSARKRNVISLDTFLQYFPLPGVLGERLFALFDKDNSKEIDFEEFFLGLSIIYNGTPDQRRRLLFDLYDLDGSGRISRQECESLLSHIPAALDALKYVAAGGGHDNGHTTIMPNSPRLSIGNSSSNNNIRALQRTPRINAVIASSRNYDARVKKLVDDVWKGRKEDDQLTFQQFCDALNTNEELAAILDLFHDVGMPELPVPYEALRPGLLGDSVTTKRPLTRRVPLLKGLFCSISDIRGGAPSRAGAAAGDSGASAANGPAPPFKPDYEGWLVKNGKTFNLPHKRYFVLRDQFLYVFNKAGDDVPRKALFLRHAVIRPLLLADDDRSKKSGFIIQLNSGRAIKLFASSREERDRWVIELTRAARLNSLHNEYQLMSPRGEGRFAVVHRAVHKYTQETVAVKIVQKDVMDDFSWLRNEVTAMQMLRHPNIVQLYEVCDAADYVYLVMEWMPAGDLSGLVRQLPSHISHKCTCVEDNISDTYMIAERLAIIVLRGVLTGLKELHKRSIVHRDIKPENILLVRAAEMLSCTEDGKGGGGGSSEEDEEHIVPPPLQQQKAWITSPEEQIDSEDNMIMSNNGCPYCRVCKLCSAVLEVQDVKLSDFGLAKILAPSSEAKEQLGTLAYVAPEVLNGQPYGPSVDLWAVGVVGYQILSLGRMPFEGDSDEDLIHAILNRQPPDTCLVPYDGLVKDFLGSLLNKDPKRRTTIDDALQHPWLRDGINRLERR